MNIFVFGANLAGIHGKGDALLARQRHGAIYGQGEGLQGRSYGIPTKDGRLRSLPLSRVREGVDRFLAYARAHSEMNFDIAAVGCRHAGFTPEQISPLFKDAPENCYLPIEFRAVLKQAGFAVNDKPYPGPAPTPPDTQGSFEF